MSPASGQSTLRGGSVSNYAISDGVWVLLLFPRKSNVGDGCLSGNTQVFLKLRIVPKDLNINAA